MCLMQGLFKSRFVLLSGAYWFLPYEEVKQASKPGSCKDYAKPCTWTCTILMTKLYPDMANSKLRFWTKAHQYRRQYDYDNETPVPLLSEDSSDDKSNKKNHQSNALVHAAVNFAKTC